MRAAALWALAFADRFFLPAVDVAVEPASGAFSALRPAAQSVAQLSLHASQRGAAAEDAAPHASPRANRWLEGAAGAFAFVAAAAAAVAAGEEFSSFYRSRALLNCTRAGAHSRRCPRKI